MLTRSPSVVHSLYGIRIRTPWPVASVPRCTDGHWDVEFVEGNATTLGDAARHVPRSQADRWAQSATLPDGSRYRRWTNLFEFLVTPDARRIQARAFGDANEEAFQAYLLVDALSYAMVRLGREPLHATAVLTPHGVVAFLGASGYGKSTLGALMVQAGCPLLTDDMLVLTHHQDGFLAHPGPPRIKLYRTIKDRIFGTSYPGIPMNPSTEKLIVGLTKSRYSAEARPLAGLYLIVPEQAGRRRQRPFIRRLAAARAFVRILAGTVKYGGDDRDRLKRQFEFVTRLVQRVPVKTLSYPRTTAKMSRVRDAVLADVARSRPEVRL
jgi:hypothetical protein